jgi:hypothetical protein
MTTIRTTCRRCGDVELTPEDLSLELVPSSGEGTYRFDCPVCGVTRRRPASHRVVSILLATGVVYDVVDEGFPITEDEIEEFRRLIDRDDWYSHLGV